MKYNWTKLNEVFFKNINNNKNTDTYKNLLSLVEEEVLNYTEDDGFTDAFNFLAHYEEFSDNLKLFIALIFVKLPIDSYYDEHKSEYSNYHNVLFEIECTQIIEDTQVEKIITNTLKNFEINGYIESIFKYKMGDVVPYDPGDYWHPPEGGYIEGSELTIDEITRFDIDDGDIYEITDPEKCKIIYDNIDHNKINETVEDICSDIDEEEISTF